jgi:hypothetical protein
MPYEHKDGQGSLFKNDYKTSEAHPAYKGQIMVKGELLDIAAWVKDGQKGQFLSLKVSEPRQQGAAAGQGKAASRPAGRPKIDDNDLPF